MVSPSIPQELLECENAPQPPLEGTQSDVALYILELYEAHADCKGDLRSVKSLLEDFERANNPQE